MKYSMFCGLMSAPLRPLHGMAGINPGYLFQSTVKKLMIVL